MDTLDIKKHSKEEQRAAMESYDALAATLEQSRSETPGIEIEAYRKRSEFLGVC